MSDPFIILSLSGGGYCGLYTAAILERIEEARGDVSLAESVDLITGTSIGGIIALGVAHGVKAKDIRDTIESNGPKLFRDDGSKVKRIFQNTAGKLRGTIKAKYRSENLLGIVQTILPDQPLSSAKIPAAVASVCTNGAKPKIFRNYADEDANSLDAAMATSAAPTFFDPYQIGSDFFVDGGIVANNPDVIGFMEAVGRFGADPKDIVIISVGATNLDLVAGSRKQSFTGLIPQIFSLRRSISFTLEVQQALARQQAEDALQSRYVRITTRPGKDAEKFAQLDRADDPATQTLLAMANSEYDSIRDQALIQLIENPARKRKPRWQNGQILPIL
ncbi:CBASS cGAMP-activated phospholipase [uncultured Ruegeria sp.]|uniref:CBASS cGAMP-activated phospholipase n=1 Tax=uncultured Ruegeria sp. TaxID=259304 RepID=UPI00261D7441|nr:CBASS cGAMP-activated phospholipase [uncultured Ruegeria sp.]